MILDTNFLVRLYQEEPSAFEKALDLHERNVIPRIPSPVIQELEYGAAFLDVEETRRKVRNVSRMYPQVDLTVFDHKRAGRLHAQADRDASGADAGIDSIAPMIAAVAHRYEEPVLTENVADFEALGVSVATW